MRRWLVCRFGESWNITAFYFAVVLFGLIGLVALLVQKVLGHE